MSTERGPFPGSLLVAAAAAAAGAILGKVLAPKKVGGLSPSTSKKAAKNELSYFDGRGRAESIRCAWPDRIESNAGRRGGGRRHLGFFPGDNKDEAVSHFGMMVWFGPKGGGSSPCARGWRQNRSREHRALERPRPPHRSRGITLAPGGRHCPRCPGCAGLATFFRGGGALFGSRGRAAPRAWAAAPRSGRSDAIRLRPYARLTPRGRIRACQL